MTIAGPFLADAGPLPQWVGFVIMLAAIIASTIIAVFVALSFRKKKRRKRKHHHHRNDNHLNPTLAQTGGLPPVRKDDAELPSPPK
ncbi:MAG TPA: hypothetical protein VFV81_06720 [Verrucomicrobiae bacterium]|nr:hypothetical protein [Verrucomicrobiae bacterium]